MNCEKCKNRKATLFFADDDGKRHALCAVCGSGVGKSVNLISNEHARERSTQFLPEITLNSLLSPSAETVTVTQESENPTCRTCGITLGEVKSCGELGCPECYVSFAKSIFPTIPTAESALGARMPSARRARLDRERILIEAKSELRRAVEKENFELAATRRDKIRSLEKQ